MAKIPTLRVKPVPGRRVMLHNVPNRAIERERGVPFHPHYTRAIARGDLELVKASPKKKRTSAKES
jgi:hypothetical protein